MSSLWTNLLFLHGYIADARLARQLAAAPVPLIPHPPVEREPAGRNNVQSWRAHGKALALRLCLGIGDGVVHTQ
ncbi:hypothetical protein [Dyella subtropica]|uniref:hypothetical protein n=1 Tax=Dyella subtropica TaxID=2992127 RepID=UPI0022594FA3|nr:hypothetical protein [Dyella subtropica]